MRVVFVHGACVKDGAWCSGTARTEPPSRRNALRLLRAHWGR